MPTPTTEFVPLLDQDAPPVETLFVPELPVLEADLVASTTEEVGAYVVAQEAVVGELPLSRKDRFFRSRLGRAAISGLAALGFAAGGVAVDAAPAFADGNPIYTVTNHDDDGTHGIFARKSPHWGDSDRSRATPNTATK